MTDIKLQNKKGVGHMSPGGGDARNPFGTLLSEITHFNRAIPACEHVKETMN